MRNDQLPKSSEGKDSSRLMNDDVENLQRGWKDETLALTDANELYANGLDTRK